MSNIAILSLSIAFVLIFFLIIANGKQIYKFNVFKHSNRIEISSERFSFYRDMIREKNKRSIVYLSNYLKLPYQLVMLEIQQMIDAKSILDVHIDEQTKMVVLTPGKRIDTEFYLKQLKDNKIPTITGVSWKTFWQKDAAYSEYRYLIRDKKMTSVEEIAKTVEKPIAVVLYELQQIIDEKYFLDIHIDEETNTLVFTAGPRVNIDIFNYQKEHLLPVVCKNCGAKNKGAARFCEFCGSMLDNYYPSK